MSDAVLRIRPRGSLSRGLATAVVQDQFDNWYLLSCGHVLTDFGKLTTIGLEIRKTDDGETIGNLHRFVDLKVGSDNLCDVGLACLKKERAVALAAEIPVREVSTDPLSENDRVSMTNRLGQEIVGRVTEIGAEERVYGWGWDESDSLRLVQQIRVEMDGERGDSGALLRDSSGRACAVFVVSGDATDLVTPIGRVLKFAEDPEKTKHGDHDSVNLSLRLQPGY